MHNWTTWWARAQRGMGLFDNQCPQRVELLINNLPDCKAIRFQFATAYDTQSVKIKNAYCYVQKSYKKYPVTFQGQTSYQISPQEMMISDEVDLRLLSHHDIYLVYEIETENDYQCASGFELKNYDYITSDDSLVYLLKSVEVLGSSLKGCICAFGDSITEMGYWSQPLTIMLRQKGYALLQLGISGNRLLRKLENVHINEQHFTYIPLEKQCFGKSGIKRFHDDVLSCHNLIGVIIALGVNDLYQPGTFCADRDELPSNEEMMDGYLYIQQLLNHKPTWVLAMTSFLRADESTLAKEKQRCQLNQLLTKHFLKVINFDNWLLNEKNEIKSEYHNGDYLHPNQKAGEIMAQLIIKEMEV